MLIGLAHTRAGTREDATHVLRAQSRPTGDDSKYDSRRFCSRGTSPATCRRMRRDAYWTDFVHGALPAHSYANHAADVGFSGRPRTEIHITDAIICAYASRDA